MLTKLKIRTQVFVGSILIIAILLISSIVSIYEIDQLSKGASNIFSFVSSTTLVVFQMRTIFYEDVRSLEEYGNGFSSLQEAKKVIEKNRGVTDGHLKQLESGIKNGYLTSAEFEQIDTLLQSKQILAEKILLLQPDATTSATKSAIKQNKMRETLDELDKVAKQSDTNLSKIEEKLFNTRQEKISALATSQKLSLIIEVIIKLLAILSVVTVFWLILRTVLFSLNRLATTMREIAEGNFGKKIEIKSDTEFDQLAVLFNQMTAKVSEYYTKLQINTKETLTRAKQLEVKNQSLENTEKAMLNILEDARGLEEDLKVEKAGVEQKVIERTTQLKEEQVRLEASINSLEVGFIMTDIQTQVLMTNGVAERMFCLSEDNIESTGALKGPLHLKCDIQMMQTALDGNFPMVENIKTCLKSQKPIDTKEVNFKGRILHIFIAPIIKVEKSLQVIGAVILIEDITEAKMLERSRDEFFSIASHELRTPLTAIRGNTSLIQQFYGDKLEDKELKEMIEDIHESSTRLIEIVNDFLDTSRLELGKIQFKNADFDLSELINEVIKEYVSAGSMKDLYLNFEAPKTPLPKVYADRDRVKQVLINLVGNALKFTEKGGITIKLQAETGFMNILVSDTGRGIPPESQKLLFRKFQQTETNILTRDTTRGTGLGLYISKLMTEAMGGKIGLESSDVNKGSTFSFTLPLAST